MSKDKRVNYGKRLVVVPNDIQVPFVPFELPKQTLDQKRAVILHMIKSHEEDIEMLKKELVELDKE